MDITQANISEMIENQKSSKFDVEFDFFAFNLNKVLIKTSSFFLRLLQHQVSTGDKRSNDINIDELKSKQESNPVGDDVNRNGTIKKRRSEVFLFFNFVFKTDRQISIFV